MNRHPLYSAVPRYYLLVDNKPSEREREDEDSRTHPKQFFIHVALDCWLVSPQFGTICHITFIEAAHVEILSYDAMQIL